MARPRGLRLNRKALTKALAVEMLSRTELAERSGVSLQMIGSLYGGAQAGASPKTARAIADALGWDAEILFPELANYGSPHEATAA